MNTEQLRVIAETAERRAQEHRRRAEQLQLAATYLAVIGIGILVYLAEFLTKAFINRFCD